MTLFDSLPFFHTVKEVACYATRRGTGHGSMVIIAPDPMAGRRARYSVLVIDCQTGRTTCQGRELPLKDARSVALDCAPAWLKKPNAITSAARS